MHKVKAYPSWRAAVSKFIEAGFQDGQVIPHTWFYDALDVEYPEPETPMETADKLRLKFVGRFERFRKALLREHQLDLENEPTLGYVVVPPKDQARIAYSDTVNDVAKALRGGISRIVHVRLDELTDAQKKEQADLLARISMVRTQNKRARQLPKPE